MSKLVSDTDKTAYLMRSEANRQRLLRAIRNVNPVYHEPDVSDFMNRLADEKDVDVQELVNEWLRVNIGLVQSATARGLDKA